MPQLIDSVGIELEVEDFVPRVPRELKSFWDSTHDASCEKDGRQLVSNELVFTTGPQMFPYRNITLGGELVSKILDTSDDSFILPIKELCDYIISQGESLESFRAGIHIHICFTSPNLRMLKGTVRLWCYLEDLFYLIGGMGYEFRGQRNDACYCRPLTKNGPIIVPTAHGHAQSLNVEDLLESKTIAQFWDRWGDMPVQGRERYFPVRYHGFNLSPAYSRGTIEFRIFNKTLNPYYIVAAINLCKSFSNFCMLSSIDDFTELGLNRENSVYNNRTKDEIAQTFLYYSGNIGLDSFSVKEIMHIIERTPRVVLSDNRIISHLRNVSPHWINSNYEPRQVRNFEQPHFVDIHVLHGER